MSSIAETMARVVIEPYLESRFITLLAEKIKTISSAIGVILHDQLEVLNESMRKIEIKENNLRGKRIYEYSREVENIKSSVAGVVDTFKTREVNRFSCN